MIKKLPPNYSERWQILAEIERQETLNETIEMRWNKLNYLFGMARGLGVSQNRDGDEDIVRERWMILTQKAGLG
jgi:hypothetical protein